VLYVFFGPFFIIFYYFYLNTRHACIYQLI